MTNNKIKDKVLKEMLKDTDLTEEQKRVIIFDKRINKVITLTQNLVLQDVAKEIDEEIVSLKKKEKYWNDKKLKAFENKDKYEGMYLGKANEIRHIIKILEELKQKIQKEQG